MRGPIHQFRIHVITAAVVTMFSLSVLVVLLAGAGSLPSLHDRYHVKALVPSAASVSPESRVTMAGVRVGRVVAVDRRGTGAILRLEIDQGHQPLPEDTKVAIRLRTLVGEKYVELVPGRSRRMLPDDGILPMSQADDFVDVDTVLSQLRGTTRQRARDALRGLGQAVAGKGDNLNRTVEGGTGLINDGAPPVDTLARQHEHITRLVSNLGQIAADIGGRGDALRSLAQNLATTASTVASRDDALERLLKEAPATLQQVRQTSIILQTASRGITPVADRIATAVNGLQPTVAALRPAALRGGRVLRELGGAAPRLERALTSAERLSGPAVATLPRLQQTLCQLNPLVRRVAPYGKEVATLFGGLASAVNAYDANGHLARLYLGIGSNSLFGVLPASVAAAQTKLLQSGLLSKFHLLGYNPYPAPGQASGTTVGATATGPQDAANKYERIAADC